MVNAGGQMVTTKNSLSGWYSSCEILQNVSWMYGQNLEACRQPVWHHCFVSSILRYITVSWLFDILLIF